MIDITGTVLNSSTWVSSPFSMSFSLSGGSFASAECGTWNMGAAVTNFSAEVGNNVLALPASFAANVMTAENPCHSGDVYGELVGGPLTLESQGPLLTDHARLFDGNVGTWYIQTAQLTIVPDPVALPDPVTPTSSVPEPGLVWLLALTAAALFWREHRRLF